MTETTYIVYEMMTFGIHSDEILARSPEHAAEVFVEQWGDNVLVSNSVMVVDYGFYDVSSEIAFGDLRIYTAVPVHPVCI